MTENKDALIFTVSDLTPGYWIHDIEAVGKGHETPYEMTYVDPGTHLEALFCHRDECDKFCPFKGMVRGVEYSRIWVDRSMLVYVSGVEGEKIEAKD